MIERLALLAEASPRIGTGHVVETFGVARAALAARVTVRIWVNAGTPSALLAHSPCPLTVVESFDSVTCAWLAETLAGHGYPVALVNFRRVENAQIIALKSRGMRVVCVDELGGSRLDCEAVINNTLLAERHRYSSVNSMFRLYAGATYMVLGEEFQKEHDRVRVHEGPIRKLTITFGGTDRSGTVLRVVEALAGWRLEMEKHVVLGAGFGRRADLMAQLASRPDPSVYVHENPPTLAPRFAACDVSFTAGGNTLYELACVGTPAIVLHEDLHEGQAGQAFQALGFGLWLGEGATACPDAIRSALEYLDNPVIRQRQSDAGKRLVDGQGAARILHILNLVVSHDPSVSA